MSAVDRINAVLAQSYERQEDKRAALMAARASEFSGIVGARDITRGRYGISILKGRVSGGEVEIFARVFRDGSQLGFGVDGSVDVERFVVVNPPVLVRDDAGDVEIRKRRYRIDVQECLVDTLADMIRIAGKSGGDIKPGKEGRTTYTIFSGDSNTGFVQCSHAAYATARSGGGSLSALTDSSSGHDVGQRVPSSYIVVEGFIEFNTASAAGTITSVTASMALGDDSSTTDFTINMRRHNYGTLSSSSFIAGDSLSGNTLCASRSTSGISTNTLTAFTSEAAFLTNINQSGMSQFVLCSSRTESNTAPTGNENITIYGAAETGTSLDPRLVIEATTGFTRTFTGPFWGPFRGPFG